MPLFRSQRSPEIEDRLESLEKALRRANERLDSHDRELKSVGLDLLAMWDKVKTAVGRVYAREKAEKQAGNDGPTDQLPLEDIDERIKRGMPV